MTKKQDLALALLRAVVGIVFIAHGYQKLFVWGIHGVAGGFGILDFERLRHSGRGWETRADILRGKQGTGLE